MSFVFGTLLIPLIISALLGLIVGWSTCSAPVRKNGWGWATYGIVAFVAGLLVAGLALLPGRPGFGLEAALMMFATYIAGCSLGCFLHNVSVGQVTVEPQESYTMRVAGIGTVANPLKAETVPLSSLPYLSGGLSRTMALKSSPHGFAMTVAAINTTAAEEIARARDAATVPRATDQATPRRYDRMALAVASINTLAGRNGVHDVLQRSKAQALFAAAAAAETAETAYRPAAAAAPARTSVAARPDTMGLAVAAINTLADRGGVQDLFARSKSMPVARAATPVDAGGEKLPLAAVVEISRVISADPTPEIPPLMSEPRNGQKDELSLIWGVAETLEKKLNAMGIWHFEQIAQWGPAHVQWFEATVEGFKGRVERDKWIEQCKRLSEGWRPDKAAGERLKK